jgi:hypothetical protein
MVVYIFPSSVSTSIGLSTIYMVAPSSASTRADSSSSRAAFKRSSGIPVCENTSFTSSSVGLTSSTQQPFSKHSASSMRFLSFVLKNLIISFCLLCIRSLRLLAFYLQKSKIKRTGKTARASRFKSTPKNSVFKELISIRVFAHSGLFSFQPTSVWNGIHSISFSS